MDMVVLRTHLALLCLRQNYAKNRISPFTKEVGKEIMQEKGPDLQGSFVQKIAIAPTNLLYGQPEVPSSKYYTLRYLLAATLANGESRVLFPAESDDSEALFRGCRALGAELVWEDERRHALFVRGRGQLQRTGPVTINVGNAGAVLRLLLGVGALLPDITFTTDHPQSLGKRPNRELLEALTALGAACEGTGQRDICQSRSVVEHYMVGMLPSRVHAVLNI